jgi:hypothetical protein
MILDTLPRDIWFIIYLKTPTLLCDIFHFTRNIDFQGFVIIVNFRHRFGKALTEIFKFRKALVVTPSFCQFHQHLTRSFNDLCILYSDDFLSPRLKIKIKVKTLNLNN